MSFKEERERENMAREERHLENMRGRSSEKIGPFIHDADCPCYGDVDQDFQPIEHPAGCANCECPHNPRNSGTRKKPIYFSSFQAALEYSVASYTALWCRIDHLDGVWRIYPGGRTVHYRHLAGGFHE